MTAHLEHRRVLLAGADREQGALRGLFASGALPGWEVVEADGFARAHFALQAQACDVVLVAGELLRAETSEGLAWLAQHSEAPLLLLADDPPEAIAEALQQGALGWLPIGVALARPALLGALLRQLARVGDLRRRAFALREELGAATRHLDRLAELLWEAAPGHGPGHWFTQRHMLERLEEELARARRHGGPLTVVLGEVQLAESGQCPSCAPDRLATWTASQVGQSKRRCDVAGQYGLHGFMLLLPRAGEGEVEGACRRLRAVLEQPQGGTGPFPPLHAYFGVARVAPGVTTLPGLLRRAEEQLEQAKEGDAQP